jgi:hypothetical protein
MTHLSDILDEAAKRQRRSLVATSAFTLIASSPAIWPNFEAGTRRYVLRKFPYSIIYREIQAVSK